MANIVHCSSPSQKKSSYPLNYSGDNSIIVFGLLIASSFTTLPVDVGVATLILNRSAGAMYNHLAP